MHVPDVDVLMPIYRPNTTWLREAIASISEGPGLDFRLVVTLYPRDRDLEDLLGELDVEVLVVPIPSEANLPEALNAGLNECNADFVARLDQDDVNAPNRLKLQADTLRRDTSIAAVASSAALINVHGEVVGAMRPPSTSAQIERSLRWRCIIPHSSVMFRTEKVFRAGGYRGAAVGAEDYDLWLRLLQADRIVARPEQLISHRLHPNQMTKNYRIQRSARSLILESKLKLARVRGDSELNVYGRHSAWVGRQLLRNI